MATTWHSPPAGALEITGVGKQEHQRDNNYRAITSFRSGSQKDRTLALQDPQSWELVLANITIRCTPDLHFVEGDTNGIILFDCRAQQPEVEFIRTAVELFHHTLAENGVVLPMWPSRVHSSWIPTRCIGGTLHGRPRSIGRSRRQRRYRHFGIRSDLKQDEVTRSRDDLLGVCQLRRDWSPGRV